MRRLKNPDCQTAEHCPKLKLAKTELESEIERLTEENEELREKLRIADEKLKQVRSKLDSNARTS